VSRILAVTPRLSDAVQSCGATLARHAAEGHDVVVACVFSTDGDPVDGLAAAALGLAGVVHLAVEDALARGYEGLDRHDGLRADDDTAKVAGAGLAVALARLEPDLVLAPLGLGGDVDHEVVDHALDELGVGRLRWLDLPFALRRTPGAPLGAGQVVVVPTGEHLAAKLEAAALFGADLERLERHAREEGERTGAGGPVELLVRR
jgi:LmbE family N-acetylglucosaminyl deacetylase